MATAVDRQASAPRFRRSIGNAHLALLASLLAVAAYANALTNPFVFDDISEILQNPSIKSLSDLSGLLEHSRTRPITNLSYALDYGLWEFDPFGYHLTNVALHVVNVLLLFSFVRRSDEVQYSRQATERPQTRAVSVPAFVASSLFAVHPLMTEAVGYISGRAEVLAASFVLASFYCLSHPITRPIARAWYRGAGLLLFALGVGTKETAIMLPLALCAYDAIVIRRTVQFRARIVWLHAPLLVLVTGLAATRAWRYVTVEHPGALNVTWETILVNLHVAERYISLLFVPVEQSIVPEVYPFTSPLDARLVATALVLGILAATAIATRKQAPQVTFGLLWFCLFLAPSSALILLAQKGQPMAEHRVYLASCGFFMAIAGGVQWLSQREPPVFRFRLTAALAIVLPLLLGLTLSRNRVWADPIMLWEDAARKAPGTFAAHYGVADAYREQGNCESAVPAYQRAIALYPRHAQASISLSECQRDLGRGDQARATLRSAIGHLPSAMLLRLALARLEEGRSGNPREALRLCQEVLAAEPESGDAKACVIRNQARIVNGGR